jgi:hypothetical protein
MRGVEVTQLQLLMRTNKQFAAERLMLKIPVTPLSYVKVCSYRCEPVGRA